MFGFVIGTICLVALIKLSRARRMWRMVACGAGPGAFGYGGHHGWGHHHGWHGWHGRHGHGGHGHMGGWGRGWATDPRDTGSHGHWGAQWGGWPGGGWG